MKTAKKATILGAGDSTPVGLLLLRALDERTRYIRWVAVYDTIGDADQSLIRAHLSGLAFRPLISIILSIAGRTEVELLIIDNGNVEAATTVLLDRLACNGRRVGVLRYPGPLDYSATTSFHVGCSADTATVDQNSGALYPSGLDVPIDEGCDLFPCSCVLKSVKEHDSGTAWRG
jgi:hypothetical protein